MVLIKLVDDVRQQYMTGCGKYGNLLKKYLFHLIKLLQGAAIRLLKKLDTKLNFYDE